MQGNIARRFTVAAFWILLCTVLPWLYYARVLGQEYGLKFGLDLKGGASITYRVRAGEGQDQTAVLEDAIRITRFRVDRFGVGEVDIKKSGTDQFTVELPGRGKEEIDRIKAVMDQTGSLEFRIVAPGGLADTEGRRKEREGKAYVPTPGYAWVPGGPETGGQEMLLEVPDLKAAEDVRKAKAALEEATKAGKPADELAALAKAVAEREREAQIAKEGFEWLGKHLSSVSAGRSQEIGGTGYEVHFAMIPERQTAFGDFTGNHIKRQMAIVLNGRVHTAPEIGSKLPGSGKIYSKARPYTLEQAQDLVTVLQSGSLAVQPEEISSFVVGPGLGEDAVRRGRVAVVISFFLVVLFMAWFYRGAGWVANLAVLLNLVMTLGVLMFLGAALSLPGIAGLLLTLGMAVDANVLVNERIREEKAAGKGIVQALNAGYDRAFLTILDSNLTTVITAAVLYVIGTGPMKGFALTLILGLGISMFTALYVTRTLFLWGIDRGILTEFRMSQELFRIEWPWMAWRRRFFLVSIVVLVAGTAAFALRPVEDKYDLEFTGGQRVVVALKATSPVERVRERLAAAGLGEVGIRTIRGRGADAAKIDLAAESDTFELTARIRDEKEGASFTGRVREAFAADLVPDAFAELVLGDPDPGTGLAAFSVVANFETETVTAEQAKEMLAAAPLLAEAKDLAVVPHEGYPGAVSFTVTGRIARPEGQDARALLYEQMRKAVEARPGVDLSEAVPQSDFIGPGVARSLRDQAVLAILLSLLLQIVYLRFRFRDFTYGFAAAIALVHDVLFTLGAVAVADGLGLAHVKINMPVIAAFLTLIGFSMNDTIVIFDRIRENLGRAVHPSSKLIDDSINQTLSRSVRTSITVFLVCITLFAVNRGAASSLEGFAYVMLMGVISGSYSTIAIASPLLLFLPVYGARLRALGTGATVALLGSHFFGLLLAFAADGTPALVGSVAACALPIHFIYEVTRWLPAKDPDALVAALPGETARAA